MGCDIRGWVIVNQGKISNRNFWCPIVKIDNLIHRNYDMFGCLFGVSNYANFKPIAEGRSLPKDLDSLYTFLRSESEDFYSTTWINWKEIKKINWDEKSEKPITNKKVYWRVKGKKIQRKDALSSDWKLLFDLMKRLAKDYGDENIRLVVWFSGADTL